MKRNHFTLALVCCGLAAWPLLAAEADTKGAEVRQFRIKMESIKSAIDQMSRSADRLLSIKEQLIDPKGTDKDRIIEEYLTLRMDSIKSNRNALEQLGTVIDSWDGLDFGRPSDVQVISTYLDDSKSLVADLDLLEAQARELGPNASAETNMMVKAVAETKRAMANALAQLNSKAFMPSDDAIDKDKVKEYLKTMQVALALRQNTQVIEYKLMAQYSKVRGLQKRFADLYQAAFAGMPMRDYMANIPLDAQETENFAAGLANMISAEPLPGVPDIDLSAEKQKKIIDEMNQRPRNFENGGVTYRYDRLKDRYYWYEPAKAGKQWAPFDYETMTGRYVRPVGSKWFSSHPSYGDRPREVFADSELENTRKAPARAAIPAPAPANPAIPAPAPAPANPAAPAQP